MAQGRYGTILVPLDGSGWAQRAIPHAAEIARAHHSKLILLHVFRSPLSAYADQLLLAGQAAQVEQLRAQMQQYLAGLRAELERENLDVEVQFIEGSNAAELICDFVNSQGVNLVVMCTHGHSGILRFIFGSVASKVMQGVRVPVMLVRPDDPGG